MEKLSYLCDFLKKIIIEDSIHQIVKFLQLGISIPILPQFRSVIKFTLEKYNSKAIILYKKHNKESLFDFESIIGMSLLYSEESTLFFGFFRVYDHSKHNIQLLLGTILDYAKKNSFITIRGPINIPTILFGFGFMVEGSKTELSIARPIDPPIYLEIFKKNRFIEKEIIDTYISEIKKLEMDNFNELQQEFEFIMIGSKEIGQYKDDFIRLHNENMPENSQITPKTLLNAEIIIKYLFSGNFLDNMGWITIHSPTKIVIACGFVAPNPFNPQIISFEHIVIDKKYRRKGLLPFIWTQLMTTLLKRNKEKMPIYTSGFCNIDNQEIINFIINYCAASRERRHIILEFEL